MFRECVCGIRVKGVGFQGRRCLRIPGWGL